MSGKLVRFTQEHLSSSEFSDPSYSYLSSSSNALANVLAFLDPYQIDDAIPLGAQSCIELPLKDFPMTDEDYFDAKEELCSRAVFGARNTSLDIHRVTQRSLRRRLSGDEFRQGFRCACLLLEKQWPSRRKMANVVLGNWPEFDSLNSHVHELSSIYNEHLSRLRYSNIVAEQRKLVCDAFLNVLLLSTW